MRKPLSKKWIRRISSEHTGYEKVVGCREDLCRAALIGGGYRQIYRYYFETANAYCSCKISRPTVSSACLSRSMTVICRDMRQFRHRGFALDMDKTVAGMQFATPLPEDVHRSEAVQTRLSET